MVQAQHDARISRLEKKDEENDKKFERVYKRIEETEKKSTEQINRVYQSLEDIKKGQHEQDKLNMKMDFTLTSINREREEEKERREEDRRKSEKNMNTLKWSIFSLIGTLIVSLLVALIRTWLGI